MWAPDNAGNAETMVRSCGGARHWAHAPVKEHENEAEGHGEAELDPVVRHRAQHVFERVEPKHHLHISGT
jgi:hypothetical protein